VPDYPVNLRVDGVAVLVVGEGSIAGQKADGLRAAGAVVNHVGPDEYAGVDGHRLVFVATGDAALAQRVHDDADAAGLWVNSADDPDRCSFTLPAVLRRGDVLVTVSTAGRSPALARWLRDELAAEAVGPEHETLLDVLAEVRQELRAAGRSTELPGWKTALRSGMLDRIREGDLAGARELLRTCLSSSSG
jgi:siroheme synthase-like protein